MKKVLLTILVSVCLCACTNEGDANKALTALAFTNIEFTGYKFFACSRDDDYHTGFKAINSVGKPVEGVVCEGFLFKNSTVRFD